MNKVKLKSLLDKIEEKDMVYTEDLFELIQCAFRCDYNRACFIHMDYKNRKFITTNQYGSILSLELGAELSNRVTAILCDAPFREYSLEYSKNVIGELDKLFKQMSKSKEELK